MQVPIFVDFIELADEFSLSGKQVEQLLDYTVKEVTSEFYRAWINQAEQTLHSSRREYIRNLIVVDEGLGAGAVVLTGQLPNMIENGVGSFDEKIGFMNSSKKHLKKNGEGWFLTIPFRWAVPTSLGESEVFSGSLPEEIHEIVKAKEANKPIPGGMVSSSLKLNEIPTQFREPETRWGVGNIPESKTFQEYKNKTSLYEGIQKVVDEETGQNRYQSFRRVSDLSDPNSWINSGINAYELSDKAMSELDIPTIVDKRVDNFLNSIGF